MRSLGIWTYADWSALDRRDRTRWLAFYLLEKGVEAYSMHADGFQKLSPPFTLADWRSADEATRDMKIKQIRNN